MLHLIAQDKLRRGIVLSIAAAAIVIGYFSLSVGLPLITVGITLIALGPAMDRKEIFWPILGGVILFNLVYLALAPGGCTTYSGNDPELLGQIHCRSIFGYQYSGEGQYSPSLTPAFAAGAITGAVAAATLYLALRPSRDERTQEASAPG